MASNEMMIFNGGFGQLIGSYVSIGYGSVIKYIELVLSHVPNTLGRSVTLAYWTGNVDINNLKMNPADSNGPKYCTSISTSGAKVDEQTNNNFTTHYVRTGTITSNSLDVCRFYFNQEIKVKASKIFVALISINENNMLETYKNNSTLSLLSSPGHTLYIKDKLYDDNGNYITNSNDSRVDNYKGLYINDVLVVNPDGDSSNSEESSNLKPAKIACSDLRYRTWSDPDGDFNVTTSNYYNTYTNAFVDGGHAHSDVSEYNTLSYKYNGEIKTLKTHIKNTTNNFENDFHLPEGRLKDVVFAYPEREAYDFDASTSTGATEGRWVFKRSRIKFTIPPATKNGKPINKGIILRYKIITSIFDKSIYTSEYKTKIYSADEATKNIELVICPRDEGVLDNMEFAVHLSRKYKDASNANYSTEAIYKFHTYQKPTVNIASPKIIRNSSTGSDFKYAKILTSNMYSNFNGERSLVNKYVCDALTVTLATSQNDASSIPMFVRFYLAEYKYGRDGRYNATTGQFNEDFETVQSLYKSQDESKYTSKYEILTGKFLNDSHKPTASLTAIYTNDGHPILLSGRFTNYTLANVGQNYKLWTYKDWDYVVENIDGSTPDELVGNAWEVTTPKHDDAGHIMYDSNGKEIMEVLTRPVIGDHIGAPIKTYWSDGHVKAVEQKVSKTILFRAGYVYLLRARMFHGAAAGAIAKNYSITKKQQIIYGNTGSGLYNYEGANYSNGKTYPSSDALTHGQLNPYDGWRGPDDGTSGEQLFKYDETASDKIGSYNNKLEQTYSGFSEVDYTLIEPICPYTSKSNLVTVHPTSPQISANQWITFNYRHLAKNIAGIDTNIAYYDSNLNDKKGGYVTNSGVLGKTASGIQNTMTRIANMYTSAIKSIIFRYNDVICNGDRSTPGTVASALDKYMGNKHDCSVDSPTLNRENISIWIKPITERSITKATDASKLIGAYKKTAANNFALVYNWELNGRPLDLTNSESAFATDTFYNGYSLCYHFNEYIKALANPEYNLNSETFYYDFKNNEKPHNHTVKDFDYIHSPEWEIIYREYDKSKTGTAGKYLALNEPLGNTYRWQPVINALTVDSTVQEIQIEGQNNDAAKQYSIGENTLRQNRTFEANKIFLTYADNGTGHYYDLQTKYFYKDVHTLPNNTNPFTNDSDKRFCIKEFCGYTTGSNFGSGYPVMYTSASNPQNTVYGQQINNKYFCADLVNNESPGHIYSRVSSLQDCECGIPTPTGLTNIGNVSSKGIISINNNEDNAIPITRTTHYLYFKTWINTTFCMKVDASITAYHDCDDDEDDKHIGHDSTVEKIMWFDGNSLITDNYIQNTDNPTILDVYPNCEIKFGNENGLSEVYGEDNYGWGRCLSADDISNRQITHDGKINSQKTMSGGIEVPVMVRYTPLLQPKLLAKTCGNNNKGVGDETYLSLSSNNITLIKCRGQKRWLSSFVDGTLTDDGKYTQIETGQINLKIAYPYIKETNTYNTVSPNGGNGGNVYYDGYYIDVDTDVSKSIDTLSDSTTASTNMDFLGGSGICTGYTVLLVPSNPKLPSESSDEYKWYFNNTDGHWNYYKQPANYYKSGDIFKKVRSKTVKNCGPVLVGYNLQPEYSNSCNYLDTDVSNDNKNLKIPEGFINDIYKDNSFRGRNYQTIRLNFTDLRQGKFTIFDDTSTSYSYDSDKAKSLFGEGTLSSANILQPGVIYDLVIVPVYSNRTITNLNYKGKTSSGTINESIPSGGQSEIFENGSGEVHLAGSNPLVLYNYFQIGLETEKFCTSNTDDYTPPPIIVPVPPKPDPGEPDPAYVYDSDSAIIFPNVDNVQFNVDTGTIKEPPGFWLNNSFKLILRMPSFRLKGQEYSETDLNTIDNASNGILLTDDNKTADDFEFSDIQIHIGRITELESYGYPDEQHLNLDKITDKNELAKAHIISYKDYGHMGMGVFSKKLSYYNISTDENGNLVDEDTRELLTAGSLDPTSAEYAHRFIEVNLSNCKIMNSSGALVPIYTDYPEGFYIQFRWKSKYAESQPEEHRWSEWYGGTYDGGLKWWGGNGLNYFVPVRNYSTVYTDFRNHIKESFPGAYIHMPKEPIEISDKNERIIESIVGKGSIMSNGSINENSKNRPKDSVTSPFYHIGVGNHASSPIVPTNETLTVLESLDDSTYGNIKLNVNNDTAYYEEIQHNTSHNVNGPNSGNQFTNHQNFWEMLYVDYIIRNMCKLYYKPNYNKRDKNHQFNSNLYFHLSTPYVNGQPLILNYLTWGWDNTEYRMLNDSSLIEAYKGLENEKEFTEDKSYPNNKLYEFDEENDSVNSLGIRYNGPNKLSHSDIKYYSGDERKRWNRNKYYRRVITRQDFDELNNHLEELVEFIRHPYFTGLSDNNVDIIGDAVPISKKELIKTFPKNRAGIIGHDTSRNSGLTTLQSNNNNINHTMMDRNYIQNIWQNILSVCRPSIQVATKTSTSLKE